MESAVHVIDHGDGTFQRYQVVSGFSWNDVRSFNPGIDCRTISGLVRLYDVNIIPKLARHTGPFVFLHVPSGFDLPFSRDTCHGRIMDDSVLLAIMLEKAFDDGLIHFRGNVPVIMDPVLGDAMDRLSEIGMVGIAADEGPQVHFMPVDGKLGFLSGERAECMVNSHFFLMDPSDLDSPYCSVGTPAGLSLQDGHISEPPLYGRPALLVGRDGKVRIEVVHPEDLEISIDGATYRDGINCRIHSRPHERITPRHAGTDIVIVGNRIVASRNGGGTVIPVAGLVVSTDGTIHPESCIVSYRGLEDFIFGMQVGPAMVKDGKTVDLSLFPFFRKGEDPVSYAPTVYPLPLESARASRICLGTGRDGKPVLVWAEGAGKLGIDSNMDSTGASLDEMRSFCLSMGFGNIINLDGGGSAQLVIRGRRFLRMADRNPLDNSECERPVPCGLAIG